MTVPALLAALAILVDFEDFRGADGGFFGWGGGGLLGGGDCFWEGLGMTPSVVHR